MNIAGRIKQWITGESLELPNSNIKLNDLLTRVHKNLELMAFVNVTLVRIVPLWRDMSASLCNLEKLNTKRRSSKNNSKAKQCQQIQNNLLMIAERFQSIERESGSWWQYFTSSMRSGRVDVYLPKQERERLRQLLKPVVKLVATTFAQPLDQLTAAKAHSWFQTMTTAMSYMPEIMSMYHKLESDLLDRLEILETQRQSSSKSESNLPSNERPNKPHDQEINDWSNGTIKPTQDFSSVVWGVKSFSFTTTQSNVFRVMWNARVAGHATMSGKEILKQADCDNTRFDLVWRDSNKKAHPAWHKMIQAAKSPRGHYTIALPATASNAKKVQSTPARNPTRKPTSAPTSKK